MSPDPSQDLTTPLALSEGQCLVLRARESGDWQPVLDWFPLNPEYAEDLALFMRGEGKIPPALRTSSPDLTGNSVGGFELLEEIGRGGAGVVYRAYDPKLNRDVAVKLVRTGEASPADLARFQVEGEAVASLHHPNIVQVYASGEAGGVPYLVMPLMAGGSLDRWLKSRGPDRRVGSKEAAKIVRDIALGVHHAHNRGLIHRDLKPGNILLDAAGTPHVADFGLARRIDVSKSVTGGIAGTYQYMAPEQARGEAGLTFAVDVHALGAILFEMLTGRTPFGGTDVLSTLRRVSEDAPPPVRQFCPTADRDLEAVCLKCLEKRPEARYASAQELADDLDRFLHGEGVIARPPGFWDWLRQLARIRPEPNVNYNWPVTVWFGVTLLATNAVVYALVRGGGSARGVWAANVFASAAMCVVLWWYMLRQFRLLPVTERHSLIIAVGKILAYFPLMIAYVPFSSTVPARDAMGLYPPLGALSGLAFFILGSTNWSRFFLVGLAMMALTPVMVWWPDESPLVYGGAIALVMWYWAIVKEGHFGHKNAEVK